MMNNKDISALADAVRNTLNGGKHIDPLHLPSAPGSTRAFICLVKILLLIPPAIVPILIYPSLAYSQNARIDNVLISTKPGAVVSFTVIDAFTGDIEEAIKSGITTSFTFRVKLYRKKALWFDKMINDITFQHTVKYDSLKDEYHVTFGERRNERVTTQEMDEMKRMMSTVRHLLIVPGKELERSGTYRVTIKAELDTIDLPFPLNYMLFFVSFWNFETDWFAEDFSL